MKKINNLKFIIVILILLGCTLYYYYMVQIYTPRLISNCNELALHNAVDSYNFDGSSDFLSVLSKSLRKSTLKENYYSKSIEDNFYDKNQYELFYKQCLRSKGIYR